MTTERIDAARLFGPLGRVAFEVAALAYLDTHRRVLGIRHLVGGRDWLRLPIRLVARDALGLDARAVVLAHNHPSGDATASAADLAFTRRLALCLNALDIRLLDHFVIAGDLITSLRAAGFL